MSAPPHTVRTGPLRDRLHDLLRWVGRRVPGFYTPLGLLLGAGFALAAGALLVFTWLADEVAEGETQRFDEAVMRWVHARGTPWLNLAALEVTALGATLVVAMTVLVASAILWATRHRFSVLLLWVAIAGASVLNVLLKASFRRPRPRLFPWLVPHAGQSSFPSGHAMTATVAYLTVAYLVSRLQPSAALRWLTLAVAALVIFSVGLSRVYLGVHYPSDVMAGWVAGVAWASVCALGLEVVRHFRARRPEVQDEERDLNAEEPRD